MPTDADIAAALLGLEAEELDAEARFLLDLQEIIDPELWRE